MSARQILTIRLRGREVESGKLSIDALETVVKSIRSSIERYLVRTRLGEPAVRRGRRPAIASDSLRLYLTDFKKNSASLVFERAEPQATLDTEPRESEILEGWMDEVDRILKTEPGELQQTERPIISYVHQLHPLFKKGIDDIEVSLGDDLRSKTILIDNMTAIKVDNLLAPPTQETADFRGVILQADFRANTVSFTLHRPDAGPITCIAPPEEGGTVLDGLMHFVRVKGRARTDRTTGKIDQFETDRIEIEGEIELPGFDSALVDYFWRGGRLSDLLSQQAVLDYQPSQDEQWEAPSEEEWEGYFTEIKKKKTERLF
ncbi:MAG: hypothetical protein JRN68_04805 [Nitrososphaerota archaeon]|nr:hypothetical protein [Nitrososphaerota archaeon]